MAYETPRERRDLRGAQQFFAYYAEYYKQYEQFYEGDHPSFISDRTRKEFAKLFGSMRDNLCPVVVDSLAERLILLGWSSDSEAATKFLSDWKAIARVRTASLTVHKHAPLYGDGYVLVWPDKDNTPRLYVQSPRNMAPIYDDDGVLRAAVKAWYETPIGSTESRLRLTYYGENFVERYYIPGVANQSTTPGIQNTPGGELPADTSALTPYEEGGPWRVEHDFGRCPVFHFSNSLTIRSFAQSEIKNAIPLQLALNKTLIDLMVGAEFAGYRQRWATGLEVVKDPVTGNPIADFKAAFDRVWTAAEPNAKFGDFEPAPIEAFIKLLNDHRLEIARVTRTPAHLFMLQSGDFPSGEALKTAESPLSQKVGQRQAVWGDTWADVAAFACKIKGLEPGIIEAAWDDTTPHSEKDQAETAVTKKAAGVSESQILREMGYSDKKIAEMQEENKLAEEAKARNSAAAFGANPFSPAAE